MTAFTDELERAEALGLSCVVIHPGSHMGAGVETGIARVVAALDESLARTPGYRVKVALENTAGAGNTIGRTFGELATLIARAARPERVGVCLDTCHLFAAGYDIRTTGGYQRAMAECEATVGRRRVMAFHLNDAKAPLGSGLDRHENIGRGLLGLAPFRRSCSTIRGFSACPRSWRRRRSPSQPPTCATSPRCDGCGAGAVAAASAARNRDSRWNEPRSRPLVSSRRRLSAWW